MGLIKLILVIIAILIVVSAIGNIVDPAKAKTKDLKKQCFEYCAPEGSADYTKTLCRTSCFQLHYYGGDQALIDYMNESK